MSKIDFYYMPESPPCRTVMMVAAIAGVKLNEIYVNLSKQENKTHKVLEHSFGHKVPFIVDGDLKIGESRAIAAYLISKYLPGDTKLYPKDPTERARVDELLHIDLGVLFATGSAYVKHLFFGPKGPFDPEKEKALKEALAFLDKRLESNGGKKFMLGDDYTLADICISATMSLIEVVDLIDLSEFKLFSAYLARLKETIPHYHEINDSASKSLAEFLAKKKAEA